MNIPDESHLSPINAEREQGYIITVGRERIRVVSVFIGSKSTSEAICDAAIKKILYDHER